MAQKKNNNQSQNYSPQNTSNIDTDLFVKGMTKDAHKSFVGKENWTHCRNCINNSSKGDAGVIGNEPANLLCVSTGYTIIGGIYLFGDKWIIFSTDDTNSEIGIFDDSQCTYHPIINDSSCLGFDRMNLITGASKENYDCSWQIYWDDGLNPSRTLNIGNISIIDWNDDQSIIDHWLGTPGDGQGIPWMEEQVSGIDIDGEPCSTFEFIMPLQVNCDLLRLAPLMKTPCVKLSKAKSPGQLANGSYQAYIAYTVNEQQVGNYIGISNVQPLFEQESAGSSLDVEISNLDKNFDFYKLVILSNNQQQTQALQIGFYSTEQTRVNIDYISENRASRAQVPLATLPLQNPAYERSDKMMPVNDYLLRIGPRTNFDFNYQPLANNITAKWVSVEYPAEYYKNGGSNPTFMRDEQYSFFIRFFYSTGEKSSSYHIPGREATDEELNEENTDGNNILFESETQPWQVSNTAFVDESDGSTILEDGGRILSKGQMGYWQSTERYPAEDPHGRWGDLCGRNIRHHKFPDEQTDSTVDRSSSDNQHIRVLGVEFDNIGWPVDIEGNEIPNIEGYEILVGSREGNKSILAKGIVRNMKQYALPLAVTGGGGAGADQSIDTSSVGLMANYPYNDLNDDVYLTTTPPEAGGTPDMNVGLYKCGEQPTALGCNNFYTFHSPETSFQKPFLNPAELKSYGMTTGQSQGFFRPTEAHPKNTLIRDFAAILAAVIGVGYAISKMRGKRQTELEIEGTIGYPIARPAIEGAETAFTVGSFLAPGAAELNYFTNPVPITGTPAIIAANAITGGPFRPVGGNSKVTFEGTDVKSLPNLIGILSGVFTTMHYAAVGGQEVVDLIYNIAGPKQHAFKYNSYGLYHNTKERHSGDIYRQNINKSRYVGNTMQDFGSSDISLNVRINNLHRPATVTIQTNGTFGNTNSSLPGLNLFNNFVNNLTGNSDGFDSSRQTLGTVNLLYNPTGGFRSAISAHYVGLKFAMDNQYGQLDGIKQIPIPCPSGFKRESGQIIDSTMLFPFETFKSEVLFGGDTYLNRYNEKVIMPFFWETLNGQPDQFGFDYREYMNVPYPQYYMDTNKYDLHDLFAPITDFSFSWTSNNAIPSAMRAMDKDPIFGGGLVTWGVDPSGEASQANSIFVLRRAFMYTHCSGINDFFVESELNVGLREQGESNQQKHYDWTEFTDINALFHADIIEKGNFYKYDYSLSKTNLVSQMITYGLIQPRDYDPEIADTCYDHYTKRIIYSNQAHKEAKKDFWRVYLPNNYQDFKNVPTTVKPISKSGALILFPHLAPQLFQGVDTLTTDFNTKLTIGDGGLFNEPMQQISTADLPHEYGSCENSLSVINTPAGIFYISQAQGKIFNYAEQLTNIADAGMKQWFNTYLPSKLIQAFPEIEGTKFADNPVIGVGCTSVYDPNYDIVYFTKIDYDPCSENECIEFDPDEGFIINETECYGTDPILTCPEGTTFMIDPETGDPICEEVFLLPPDEGTMEELIEGEPTSLFANPQFFSTNETGNWASLGDPWHACLSMDQWGQGQPTFITECPKVVATNASGEPILDAEGASTFIPLEYNPENGQCCTFETITTTETVFNDHSLEWEEISTTTTNWLEDCYDAVIIDTGGTVADLATTPDFDQVFPSSEYGYDGIPDLPTVGATTGMKGTQTHDEGMSIKLLQPLVPGTEYQFTMWAKAMWGTDITGGIIGGNSDSWERIYQHASSFTIFGTYHNCKDGCRNDAYCDEPGEDFYGIRCCTGNSLDDGPCNYQGAGAFYNGCNCDMRWAYDNDVNYGHNYLYIGNPDTGGWPVSAELVSGMTTYPAGTPWAGQPVEGSWPILFDDWKEQYPDSLLIGWSGGTLGGTLVGCSPLNISDCNPWDGDGCRRPWQAGWGTDCMDPNGNPFVSPWCTNGMAYDGSCNRVTCMPNKRLDGSLSTSTKNHVDNPWNQTWPHGVPENYIATDMELNHRYVRTVYEFTNHQSCLCCGRKPLGEWPNGGYMGNGWNAFEGKHIDGGLYQPDPQKASNLGPNGIGLGNTFNPKHPTNLNENGDPEWWGELLFDSWHYQTGGYDYFEGYTCQFNNQPWGQMSIYQSAGSSYAPPVGSANTFHHKFSSKPCTALTDVSDTPEIDGPCVSFEGNGGFYGNHDGWLKYDIRFTATEPWTHMVFMNQIRPDKSYQLANNTANSELGSAYKEPCAINMLWHQPFNWETYAPNGDGYNVQIGGTQWPLQERLYNEEISSFVGIEEQQSAGGTWTGASLGAYTREHASYIHFANIEFPPPEPYIEYTPFCNCPDPYQMVLASDGITPASVEDCEVNGGPGILCRLVEYTEPISEDVITSIPLECGEDFNCAHWTASYDPKIKGWISFHDWHPELSISSHNHFLTTKKGISVSEEGVCPTNWEINPDTGLCEPIDNPVCPEGSTLVQNNFTSIDGTESIFSCCSAESYTPIPYDCDINDPYFINNLFHNEPVTIFTKLNTDEPAFTNTKENTIYFEIDENKFKIIKDRKPKKFKLNIPSLNGEDVSLSLEYFGVVRGKAKLRSKKTRKSLTSKITSYKIIDDNYSGTIIVKRNEITGIISKLHSSNPINRDTLKLSKVEGNKYTLFDYNDRNKNKRGNNRHLGYPKKVCDGEIDTLDEAYDIIPIPAPKPRSVKQQRSNTECGITMTVDIDFYTYDTIVNQYGGTVDDIILWVEENISWVNSLYQDELNTPVYLGDIHIWDVEDECPYLALEDTIDDVSTGDLLPEVRNVWNEEPFWSDYERDLVYLFSLSRYGGGRAYTNTLCGNTPPNQTSTYGYGVATNLDYDMSTQYDTGGNVITYVGNNDYVYNFKVIAHELGHSVCALHTHSTCWIPNQTYDFDPANYGYDAIGPSSTIGAAIDNCDCHNLDYDGTGYWNPDPAALDDADPMWAGYTNEDYFTPHNYFNYGGLEYGTMMSYCSGNEYTAENTDGPIPFALTFHPIVRNQPTMRGLNWCINYAIDNDCLISCPDEIIEGCTDPAATNYNPAATIDDGTCVYPGDITGCLDDGLQSWSPFPGVPAANYNSEATANCNNGTSDIALLECCQYPDDIPGCMDINASNYNPDATIDDGSCIYPPVEIVGCMDTAATNYAGPGNTNGIDPPANTPCIGPEFAAGSGVENDCCEYEISEQCCECDDGYIMIIAGSLQFGVNISTGGTYAWDGNLIAGVYTDASEEDCLDPTIHVECVDITCTEIEIPTMEPVYEDTPGGIWKHNVRCDLFNNYYGVQYPWEVELIESIGQVVNTIRSIEYQLEAYEYKVKYDEEGCILNYGCDDRWHDLMYNFDEAIIYNSEQMSGILSLVEQTPDINDILSYPIIGAADMQILYNKVEQKYRFDQFWDITSDRSISEPMFITQLNGYIRDINATYVNYDKPQLERKKFRHYTNSLILRKKVIYEQEIQDGDQIITTLYPNGIEHTRKMLLKLVNTKINLSIR